MVDTTGAGDAMVGTLLACALRGVDLAAALKLGTVVAGAKCLALGARGGLPRLAQLNPCLTSSLS